MVEMNSDDQAVIARIVDRAKPFTSDQAARLSVLLRPGATR